jgi:ankyrin repeat protein
MDLFTAVQEENYDRMFEIISEYGVDTDVYDHIKSKKEKGARAAHCNYKSNKYNDGLMISIIKKDFEMCKLMIENGADVNKVENCYEIESPLFRAIRVGNKEICELLLKNGADVNSSSNNTVSNSEDNYYPLIIAASIGNKEICELLIAHGADVNIQTFHKECALIEAIKYNHYDVCKLLIENGATVKGGVYECIVNHYMYTVPYDATHDTNNQKNILELLISNGADVDDCVVMALREYVSRPTVPYDGKNLKTYGSFYRNTKEIVEILIKNSKKINETYSNPTNQDRKYDIYNGENQFMMICLMNKTESGKEMCEFLINLGIEVTPKLAALIAENGWTSSTIEHTTE